MSYKQVWLLTGEPYLAFKDDDGEFQYPEDEWTTVEPPGGIYHPIYFDGNKWVGTSKEDWEAAQPKPDPIVPSTSDRIIGNLQIQLINHETKFKNLESKYDELRNEIDILKGSAE